MRTSSVVLLFSLLVCYVLSYQPGDIVYSVNFHSNSSLSGWGSYPWATLVPGYNGNLALQVTVPVPTSGRPETRMTCTNINLVPTEGYILFSTVLLKAINVSQPQQDYNGVKIMVVTKSSTGEMGYANANGIYGTFDWNSTNYYFTSTVFTNLTSAQLCIGLQDSSGTILVDNVNLTVFRMPPSPLPPPPINPPPAYTGHPGVDRYRGVMSPNHYYDPDISNLGLTWKANVMRWQMVWNGATDEQRNNLTTYDAWLNGKLNETDYLLRACLKYGIRVVVDLHTPPGARIDGKGDMFLLNLTYQNHFYEIWRNISKRYKGNPAVWGYDLANEPLQLYPGDPGTLQWQQLAQNTVAVIRNIDTEMTIILECEGGGDPSWFQFWRPINDTKTIYEVHMYVPSTFTFQGIPGDQYPPYPGPVYPGMISGTYWNITQLQTNLAALYYARQFQLAFNLHMYAGEFSAVRWAENGTAVNFLHDCIETFEAWGWDWTYHAYREYQGWSVEFDNNINDNSPANFTTDREALLLSWFAKNQNPYHPSTYSTTNSISLNLPNNNNNYHHLSVNNHLDTNNDLPNNHGSSNKWRSRKVPITPTN